MERGIGPDIIPDGYGVMRFGRLRPDDLVWDWCQKTWRRHDSPDWDQTPAEFASDVVCAARSGYRHIRRELPPATPPPIKTKPQASLF